MLPHKKITILVVDDELSIRESLRGWLEQDGYKVETAVDGPTALAMIQENHFDIMLLDVKMPKMNGITVLMKLKERDPETAVVLMTAHGAIQDAVAALKLGAYDYLLKPFELEELSLTIEKLVQMQTLAMENLILKDRVATFTRFENLVGQSPPMLKLFETIVEVAKSDATVLITGESGTGKELVAQSIHSQSCPLLRSFYCRQLRGLHGTSPGERTLRPGARSLHRRQIRQEGPAGNGQQRHALSR